MATFSGYQSPGFGGRAGQMRPMQPPNFNSDQNFESSGGTYNSGFHPYASGNGQPMWSMDQMGGAMGSSAPFGVTNMGYGAPYKAYNSDGTYREIPNKVYNVGVGGGGGMGGYSSALSNAYNEAKAANEQRYDQIGGFSAMQPRGGQPQYINGRRVLTGGAGGMGGGGGNLSPDDQYYNNLLVNAGSGYTGDYVRNMMDLAGSGKQALTDINTGYDKSLAAVNAEMESRGLGASSLAANRKFGVERERSAAYAREQAQQTQRRIGLDTQLTDRLRQFEERRQDPYPDVMNYAQLAQQYGRGGYG